MPNEEQKPASAVVANTPSNSPSSDGGESLDLDAMFNDDGTFAELGDGLKPVAKADAGDGEGAGGDGDDKKVADGDGKPEDDDPAKLKADIAGMQSQFKSAEPFIRSLHLAVTLGDDDASRQASDAEALKLIVGFANARSMTPSELVTQLTGKGEKASDPGSELPKPSKPVSQMTDEEYDDYQAKRDEAVLKLAETRTLALVKSQTGAMDKALKDSQAQAELKSAVQKAFPVVSAEIKRDFAGFEIQPVQLAQAMVAYPHLKPDEAVRLKLQKELFAHAGSASGPKNGRPGPEMTEGKKGNKATEPDWENDPISAAMQLLGGE